MGDPSKMLCKSWIDLGILGIITLSLLDNLVQNNNNNKRFKKKKMRMKHIDLKVEIIISFNFTK